MFCPGFGPGTADFVRWRLECLWRDPGMGRGRNSKSICVAFDPNGRYLVTGSDDKTIRFWDIATGEEIGMIDAHERIRRLEFVDADTLVSASREGSLHLWTATPSRDIPRVNLAPRMARPQ